MPVLLAWVLVVRRSSADLATSDILPEAHAQHPSRLTLATTVLGVGVMWLVIGLAG